MMCSANCVIMSVVEVFIHSLDYSKLCNFACVSPSDSKAKIKRCVSAKYATSIVSWLKILYSRDILDTDDMFIICDEVEEAAEDRKSWRNRVAQCVFDAGWTKNQ